MSEVYSTVPRRTRFYTQPKDFTVRPVSYSAVLVRAEDGTCSFTFTKPGVTANSKITAAWAQNGSALGTLYILSQVDNEDGTGTAVIQSNADEGQNRNIIITVNTL